MHSILNALNKLVADRIIRAYAIDDAIAAAFYIEAAQTEDIDAFVFLPDFPSGILLLTPIYDALTAVGGVVEREYVRFENWPLQILTRCHSPDRRGNRPGHRGRLRWHSNSCLPGGTPLRHRFADRQGKRLSPRYHIHGTGSNGPHYAYSPLRPLRLARHILQVDRWNWSRKRHPNSSSPVAPLPLRKSRCLKSSSTLRIPKSRPNQHALNTLHTLGGGGSTPCRDYSKPSPAKARSQSKPWPKPKHRTTAGSYTSPSAPSC